MNDTNRDKQSGQNSAIVPVDFNTSGSVIDDTIVLFYIKYNVQKKLLWVVVINCRL